MSAIQSVLNQTHSNFELIVIDDGSTDNTAECVKSLSDERIRYIKNDKNVGLPETLNRGVLEANADYIARMDADDFCVKERFEIQLEWLQSHLDVDLVSSNVATFDDETNLVIGIQAGALDHDGITRRPWSSVPMPHPTWMGRTSWFRENKYANVARAEDQEVLLRALPNSRYARLPEILLFYRVRGFNFRGSFIARLSLMRAQVKTFSSRGQFAAVILVLLTSAAKILSDVLVALGVGNVRLQRRLGRQHVSMRVQERFNSLLRQMGLNMHE